MSGTQHLLDAFGASRNPCLIFCASEQGFRVMAISQPMLIALGCKEEEILQKHLSVLSTLHPAFRHLVEESGLIESLQRVVNTKKLDLQNLWFPPFLTMSGSTQTHAWQSENVPVTFDKGAVEYILHSVSEIPIEALEHRSDIQIPKRIKQAFEQLQLKRAYNENNVVLESIGDAFFRVDENYIITYWNNQAEKLLDQPRENVLGKNLWEMYSDAVDTAFSANYEIAFKEQRVVHFESLYAAKNIWLEVSAFPSLNGLSVFFKNITDRKNAAEKIRDSEEKNRLIMNAALDAIVCIDKNGDVTFWNPQASMIFGWSSDEVMGKQLSSFIIPERFRPMHDGGIRRYLETGEERALNRLLELHAVNRLGQEFPIELTVIPIKHPNDEFFCAFVRDISARKKIERKLRESNERFEKVSEATNDAIWDWDIAQNTLYRGPGFNVLFEFPDDNRPEEEEFWKNHFHPDDKAALEQSLNECIDDETATHWQMEYRIIRGDGKVCSVIDRGIVIRDEAGQAKRMVGAMTDITYRKEYEESLRKLNETLEAQTNDLVTSNKELEQFAYVASHDLQEPLRMVTSFLKQLENKYADIIDERGKKYIYFAVDGAKRMRQIILDLLEFSRVGRGEDRLEMVDTDAVVREVINLYITRIEEEGAVLEIKNMPAIMSYRIPLAQIFQNLISNALKYRNSNIKPQIRVSATETDTTWQFEVKDNGIGIAKEFHERIFIIFQRLHNKDEYSGTGLGLAMVKKIITNMGGIIWVESEEGKGTSIHFTIPKSKVAIPGGNS